MDRPSKFIVLGDMPTVEEMKDLGLDTSFNSRYGHREVYAEKTDERRSPKKGEWYISGAIPTAYRAPNDLGMVFWIARLVRVKKQIDWVRY